MRSEQPLYKNERRKHKLNTQLAFAHKQYLDYDHPRSSFYHPQSQLQKGSGQISINHSRDPLSGSIAAGMIWIKRLILIQLLLLFKHMYLCMQFAALSCWLLRRPLQLFCKGSIKRLHLPEAGGMMMCAVPFISSTTLFRIYTLWLCLHC